MGLAGDNFVYSKKDLMVAGVAASIVVVMLGLGFGLTTGASLPGTKFDIQFKELPIASNKTLLQALNIISSIFLEAKISHCL